MQVKLLKSDKFFLMVGFVKVVLSSKQRRCKLGKSLDWQLEPPSSYIALSPIS